MRQLTELLPEPFFTDCWRQQPVLFKQPFDSDLLAALPDLTQCLGLACDDLAEARLVQQIQHQYQLIQGPFEPFTSVPDNCLLMINGAEQFLPELQLLLDSFSLLPRWRIDDIMLSHGPAGSSCGAHFDYYDVFLLQLNSAKCWQLDTGGHDDSHLVADADIRLLKTFECTQDIVAEPGDLLYLPPGVGHHGINLGDDGITLSLGLRNPTLQELVSHYADLVCDELDPTALLNDPVSQEINQAVLKHLSGQLEQALKPSPDQLAHWYARYMSEPRTPELMQEYVSEDAGRTQLQQLACHPATRIAPVSTKEQCCWYVNGELLIADLDDCGWMEQLTLNRNLDGYQGNLTENDASQLRRLVESGALVVNM